MAPPKRHHYVPETLSQHFTDGHWLWYYDQRQHKHGIRNVTPEGAFWRPHLNTVITFGGKKLYDIEVAYARQLENHVGPVLKEIIDKIRAGLAPRLERRARSILQHFVFSQWKRPPDSHEAMLPLDRDNGLAEALKRLQADESLDFPPALRARLGTPEFLVETQRNIRTIAVSRPNREMHDQLSAIGLYYIRAKTQQFAICSHPVVKVKDGSIGGIKGKAVVLLPIASDIAVAFGDPAMNGNVYSCDFVDRLNGLGAKQSSALAACKPELVQELLKPLEVPVRRAASA